MLLAATLSLLHPLPAASGVHTAGALTMRIGVGTAHYSAEESLPDGRVFNIEQGELQRTTLELTYTRGGWSLQGGWEQASGTLDYRGQTQFGIPLYTLTDLQRRAFALSVGHDFLVGDVGQALGVGVGMERLRTRRAIRSTPISSDLTEILLAQQWVVNSSARFTTALAQTPLRLTGSLRLIRPWAQTLAVDTHGLVDPFELRPSARWGGKLGLGASLRFPSAFELGMRLGTEIYRPGTSERRAVYRSGVPSGAASYPGSKQTLYDFGVEIAWSL